MRSSSGPCLGWLAVFTILLATPCLAEPTEPELLRHSAELKGGVRLGGTAGHVLAAPMAFALPGGGGGLSYRFRFNEDWHLELRSRLNLGLDEAGELGGGYGVTGAVGYCWGDKGWTRLESDLHLGLTSYSLFPVPALGLHHKWGFYPVELEWMVWDITLQATTDLLVVVPSISAGVSTGLTFSIGPVRLGLEIGAEGGVLIALIANMAGGAISAKGVVGIEL